MAATCNPEEPHWYVLNFVSPKPCAKPQACIDAFNKEGARLELFAPTVRMAEVAGGKVVFKEKMLTFFYVFVRGLLADVKALCAIPGNGFSFMLDRVSGRHYGIVGDEAMEGFKQVARLYSNTLPFYDISGIELEAGDLVEVVDGAYSGLVGTYLPKSRSNKGNLVIAASASLGTVVWDVEARYVRILEFSRTGRRPYELLDSFIPKLYAILRKHHSGAALGEKDKSQLAVFNRRMGAVRLPNHKLEAKLLAVLMSVQTLLGDMRGYAGSSRLYAKRRQAITNVWTRGLCGLLISIARRDVSDLSNLYSVLTSASAAGGANLASHRALLAEYRHYLGLDAGK